MTRRRWIQIEGKLVDADELSATGYSAPMIIEDLKPYRSMVTGEIIEGRSQHRNHLRTHGVVEVGNDLDHAKPKSSAPPPGLKETLARVAYERLHY